MAIFETDGFLLISAIFVYYFPMQNLSKIFPRTSSGVTSPRMEERWWRAWRRSSERRSGVWEVVRENLTFSRDAAALIRDW